MKKIFLLIGLLFIMRCAFAQGTAFTYQGRLNSGTNAANGSYDMTFALFDASTGGIQQGGLSAIFAIPVSNGLFTVSFDLGNNFPGADRWLEIAVRTNSGGALTTLTPRQKITAAPYAITAGKVIAGGITAGTYGSAVTFNSAGNNFSGTFTGVGSGLTSLNANNLSSGTVSDLRLSANVDLLNANQTFTGAKTFSAQLLANNHVRLNGSNIWFLGGSDNNHGLGYYGTANGLNKFFGASNPDGPVLFGFGGGALG